MRWPTTDLSPYPSSCSSYFSRHYTDTPCRKPVAGWPQPLKSESGPSTGILNLRSRTFKSLWVGAACAKLISHYCQYWKVCTNPTVTENGYVKTSHPAGIEPATSLSDTAAVPTKPERRPPLPSGRLLKGSSSTARSSQSSPTQ